MKAVCLFSGGIDSVVVAYQWMSQANREIKLLTFDYGQRHVKELKSSVLMASKLGNHHIIDLEGIGSLIRGSSLTDDINVPDGHYTQSNMDITIVPSRNAIFLSLAWAYASTVNADIILCGVHAGDHYIYPDCRPDFIEKINDALQTGSGCNCKKSLKILAPFISKTKGEIVSIGAELGVPFEKTWTCYKGLEKHCGTCGSCVERKEAFQKAFVEDPTEYIK